MSADRPSAPMMRDALRRLARAGLLTAVTDGLFSSVLSVAFYGSTVTRLFQGVAATLLGKGALDGGTATALVGVLMHFGVAFGWSAVFLLLAARSARLRRALATPRGTVAVAAAYGPFVWLVMSLVVIPLLVHRPPAITYRWWVQLVGHFPFVGLPIVASIARRARGAVPVPAVVLLPLLAAGLAAAPSPLVAQAAPAAPRAPADTPTTREQRLLADWASLARYREANAALPRPKPGERRVVFYGNSITEAWAPHFGALFPGKPYVGRGISAQTTPQLLVRFRQDVVALRPAAVVILAGTNDIAGNTGPSSLEMIEDNLTSMAELARANGIRVVLCSVLPAYDYPWRRGLEPAPKIVALNAWMKTYAASHGAAYVDFHSAMADERQGLRGDLSADGVHPNEAGYRVMAPLVERGIARALRGR